jgi:hypothetical protein
VAFFAVGASDRWKFEDLKRIILEHCASTEYSKINTCKVIANHIVPQKFSLEKDIFAHTTEFCLGTALLALNAQ